MTDILSLDIATNCGWARGIVGGQPTWGSFRFGGLQANKNAVFWNAVKWISQLLEPRPRPDILIVEAMLPPIAKFGHTNRETRDRLAGLHGIIRGIAYGRGVGEIAEASVGDVRAHFICDRRLQSEPAKREVMRQCQRMGWKPETYDESDALALWSFACSLVDPKLAVKITPLFRRTASA